MWALGCCQMTSGPHSVSLTEAALTCSAPLKELISKKLQRPHHNTNHLKSSHMTCQQHFTALEVKTWSVHARIRFSECLENTLNQCRNFITIGHDCISAYIYLLGPDGERQHRSRLDVQILSHQRHR